MSRSVSAPSSVTKTSPCWNGFIVPGSTLRYGSSFCIVTRSPRARSRWPRLDAVSPLPREEATPPVTKMCFVVTTTDFNNTSSGAPLRTSMPGATPKGAGVPIDGQRGRHGIADRRQLCGRRSRERPLSGPLVRVGQNLLYAACQRLRVPRRHEHTRPVQRVARPADVGGHDRGTHEEGLLQPHRLALPAG